MTPTTEPTSLQKYYPNPSPPGSVGSCPPLPASGPAALAACESMDAVSTWLVEAEAVVGAGSTREQNSATAWQHRVRTTHRTANAEDDGGKWYL